MKRKIVLITAGPTKEYIDPVRFISNDSSGKMGYLLAEKAKKRETEVILISGHVNLKPPKNVKVINVVTAEQMFGQVTEHIKKCDVFISCAAVCDYKPERFSKNKIKKTNSPINLKLVPNPDILKCVTQELKNSRTQEPIVVGFALESQNFIRNAQKKLHEKNLDMIIANNVNSLNSDRTTGAIITKNKIEKFKNTPKKFLAKKIIKKIYDLL